MSTPLQRRQIAWLRSNIVSRAADGQRLDETDIAALPARFRSEVKALAEHCASLHAAGERGAAQIAAREGIGGLADELPDSWEPPDTTAPDPAVIAEIRLAS